MRYFSFQWHITDECDQRCKHCYIFSGSNTHIPEIMSRENLYKVFDNCIDFCKTFEREPYFYITGGDPILHKNFWELLELFKANGIFFSILGNPFHIDYEVCKKLKSLGCEKYQLSIDGLKTTHDFFRKPGSFDTTLEKISVINKAQICSVIMSTVSKLNLHEISDVIDVVVEHEAEVYSFARYCPTDNEKSTGITPSEYREFLTECKDSKVGNALENKLSDLWLNEMENYREYKNFVKCSKCELLAYCRGCPAVAKGTYGDFYSPDPQCWKEI